MTAPAPVAGTPLAPSRGTTDAWLVESSARVGDREWYPVLLAT